MANLPPRKPPNLGQRGSQGMPENPNRPSRPGGTGPLPPQPPGAGNRDYGSQELEPAELPDLQRGKKKKGSGSNSPFPGIAEHRIEYLAWGLAVLIVGCGIILLAVDAERAFPIIRVGVPLIAGTILLGGAVVQKFLHYSVNPATWTLAVLGVAFGSTQILIVAIDRDLSWWQHILYFLGFFILISGLALILRVFLPEEDEGEDY